MSAAHSALLIVDDNEDNRYTLTRRLRREGYENLTTSDGGEEALDLLRSRPFDLVLLDVMMPGLNGYEVLERLRADSTLRHIPVIMISALDEIDSVIRCIELGAEDYLPKPFNPTLLRARVGASLDKKRLFNEIAEKNRQLEQASKHKSRFLASMSHELRTPLNAILGFNEMILGGVYGEVPADMKEPLADIETSGKHLLRLINNVLDLAKIEAGRMELAVDDYSVRDTVEGVRSTLRPLAEAKGLEFAVDVPPDIPLARGDGGRITQCLMNLAGNSLKFTKQGSVGISVSLTNGTLTYKVQDTGIGIPADKIENLFTEFKQTDATIASEYGGTGLGLSITKKFIEMHGGRIWAESEPGRGSTFIFEVPLRAGGGG